MTCSLCSRQLREGDKIQFTGMSVFHEVPIVKGQELRYAVERPNCVTNVQHLVCDSGD